MPPARAKEESAVDPRIYLGMLLFRWQIIVVCFIYALLAGVVYIQWSPKKYSTFCRLMLYREREVRTVGPASPWASENAFVYLLQSAEMQGKVVQRLYDKWGRRIGSRAQMWLPVTARWTRALGSTLDIWITSEYPKYAEEYLRVLLEEVQTQWESMERQARDRAVNLLESELARLQEKIREAENELIEYQRLNDIARVEAKMSMETRYLNMLIAQRSALQTEMMLLEQQHPFLKEENVGVIVNVDQITRDTAALMPPEPAEGEEEAPASGSATELEEELARSKPRVALAATASVTNRPSAEAAARAMGWQNLRVRLAELQQREQELLTNLKPEHPSVVEIRKQIAAVQTQLRTMAKIQLESLRDRYRALQIALNAIEAVEYKWQLKHLFASQKRAEMNRIAAVVNRFEGNYRDVYNRLHDLKVSEELKAYHFSTLHPPRSSSRPVWPDAKKILLMVCALGLGGGVGLALLLQVMDNKIQSIKDVEQVLGIPFLGGVPFWVHSGLEKSIRPIVTEERATGAIEAYRALRRSIV
ncbi:MAG: GumC family protein, partial [Kiritimatiellia bacterium]